jgi:hypothetical protein
LRCHSPASAKDNKSLKLLKFAVRGRLAATLTSQTVLFVGPDAVSERPQIQNPIGMANKQIPSGQRPACTIVEACDSADLGRMKLYQLIDGGALYTITIGHRR